MSNKKSKTAAANVRVPQNDEEAAEFITEIGALNTQLNRIVGNLKDDIGDLKKRAAQEALPVANQHDDRVLGLKMYCEANRARLTRNFVTKTIQFATGKVQWRARPAAVSLKDKIDVMVERIKALGLTQFIRTKETVDKEAMLKEANLAETIAGVTIASAGEDFTIGEQDGSELAEAASQPAEAAE